MIYSHNIDLISQAGHVVLRSLRSGHGVKWHSERGLPLCKSEENFCPHMGDAG